MTDAIVVSADKEIIELARELENIALLGVLDPLVLSPVLGLPVLGDDDEWTRLKLRIADLKAILAVDSGRVKERLATSYGIANLLALLSPHAHISPSAALGEGCLVQRGVTILSDARIGRACKINVNATVHHDAAVGDFCTLAPGCQLLGAVIVGDRVFVGAGAVVLPKVRIGADAVIGAGAVVVSDVAPAATVAGVPARPLTMKAGV